VPTVAASNCLGLRASPRRVDACITEIVRCPTQWLRPFCLTFDLICICWVRVRSIYTSGLTRFVEAGGREIIIKNEEGMVE
jgi:hypothetical protein